MNAVKPSWRRLVKQIHEEERGAISIETILVIAVIALPVLAFILKVAWPRIQAYWDKGATDVGF